VLDGGPCRVGIESTVVFVDATGWQVLRPGRWTAEALTRIAAMPPRPSGSVAPRTPGQLASHYAPRTPLLLCADRTALLATQTTDDAVLELPADAAAAAAALYDALHRLDASGARRIVAQLPPDTPEWAAVRDRLTRAATPP
jgi:L-threonylcarbamoyladenylate synthase